MLVLVLMSIFNVRNSVSVLLVLDLVLELLCASVRVSAYGRVRVSV